jgi:hypothetical protein
MQADDAMPDRHEGDGEDLAVQVADVLREDPRGGGGVLGERPVGEGHAGLTDEGDSKAGGGSGSGWAWLDLG